MNEHFLPRHGGDKLALSAFSGRQAADILDFSVNVRPDGPPEALRLALVRAVACADSYPSPRGEEARAACARALGLSEEQIVVGNGTSELFHALARVLRERGCPCAAIPEPAFGEYAVACRKAGLATVHPACTCTETARQYGAGKTLLDWELPVADILALPEGAALFVANPGNPAGTYLSPAALTSLMHRRPDLVYVVDEAFAAYAGRDSLVSLLPLLAAQGEGEEPGASALPKHARVVVVRSLTKFHALAGVRVGYLAATQDLAQAIQAEIPEWNVNCFALAAMDTIFARDKGLAEQMQQDACATRAANRANRRQLLDLLAPLPLRVCRSAANYLLLRLDTAQPDLARDLLQRFGIAVRDCATYQGLEDGRWYRVAVRGSADNARLVSALKHCLPKKETAQAAKGHCAHARKKVPALMLQGTSSGAGKTIMAAAFCRIFHQDGFSVAPFKAQNMSLNSGVTYDDLEMSRAQILQARAAGLAPDVRMNPLLLKPLTDKGSQVILLGRPHATMEAREFLQKRASLREAVCRAYHDLAAEHDVMVLEGAGSPAEVNLKETDLVNMNMAKEAGARVILVGDIDCGGVYASFLGSWLTFTRDERALLAGFLVNRFRGDETLLAPAHEYVTRATGVPVLGVVPYVSRLDLPEEDSLSLNASMDSGATMPDALDVAMVVLGRTSNFTDMAPLALEPDVSLRPVHEAAEWGNPDIVILPGSRSVAQDAQKLAERGLLDKIVEHARSGGWLVGICGGMQMLGEEVLDPLHLESDIDRMPGLGLLPLSTTLEQSKALHYRERVDTPLGISCHGYEIHHGQTRLTLPEVAVFTVPGEEQDGFLGVLHGHVLGTYLHGLFDSDEFRRAFLDQVRTSLGKKPQGRILATWDIEKSLDRLADTVRSKVDMDALYKMLGLK